MEIRTKITSPEKSWNCSLSSYSRRRSAILWKLIPYCLWVFCTNIEVALHGIVSHLARISRHPTLCDKMPEPLFDNEFLKKLDYLSLIAKRLVFGRRQALRQSVKKGASIEFKDFRNYVHGNDPRTIDWAVYARLDELVIKLFRQEEELDLWVLVDASGSMNFGEPNKFDCVRRIAAALAYIGMNNMDSASARTFSEDLGEGRDRLRGRGRIFDLLDFFTQLSAGGRTDLNRAARDFVSRVRRPGLW